MVIKYQQHFPTCRLYSIPLYSALFRSTRNLKVSLLFQLRITTGNTAYGNEQSGQFSSWYGQSDLR